VSGLIHLHPPSCCIYRSLSTSPQALSNRLCRCFSSYHLSPGCLPWWPFLLRTARWWQVQNHQSTDENVFRLEISVNNAQSMDVSQALEDLTEKSPDLCRILVKVPSDKIPKSLWISVSKLPSTRQHCSLVTYSLFTVLHGNIEYCSVRALITRASLEHGIPFLVWRYNSMDRHFIR
jgi:hypothetical protein